MRSILTLHLAGASLNILLTSIKSDKIKFKKLGEKNGLCNRTSYVYSALRCI